MRKGFIFGWALLGLLVCATSATPAPDSLLVIISVDQPVVALPFAVPVKLHFHNAGTKALWLYRPVTSLRARNSGDSAQSEEVANTTHGGATLSVSLEPAAPVASAIQSAAGATALVSTGLPHPKLIRLAPGEDADETAFLQFTPAMSETPRGPEPILGRYTFSVTYAARFSNASEIARDLGALLWEGETASNSITLDLQRPNGKGSIAGSIVDAGSSPIPRAVASLSDSHLQLLAQEYTDDQGRFSFSGLPYGFYWVTARLVDATVETAAVRHFVVSTQDASNSADIAILPLDIYDTKQVLHKPVLLRVTDNQNHPQGNVMLKLLSAQQPVVDSVQARTDEEGLTAVELIPGSIFVTLERRGCKEEDQRIEVAQGSGVDGASLEYDCKGQ
jgi:hypothetical protein